MFCNFCENFENSKWPPFWARQKIFENWENYSAEIPCGLKISSKSLYLANFAEIALSRTIKEIEANLCFAIVGKNSKFKMAATFGEGKIFGKLQRVHSLDTLWVENFAEIALSRTLKEIETN